MRACAGPFNVASLRNVGLLGSKSGLGSTGGVYREGLLGRDVLERERQEGEEGQPQLGVSRRESQTLELVNATSFPTPTSPLLPPPLAPAGCWQTDGQTDSAHIDWLRGTEPKPEPLNTQAWTPRLREGRGSGCVLEEHMCLCVLGGRRGCWLLVLKPRLAGLGGGGGC